MAELAIAKKKGARDSRELTDRVALFFMTSDQFCELPGSDTGKLELLDGEVFMSPRPSCDHQYFLSELLVVLKWWTRIQRLGRVLPDVRMKLDGKWTPVPDLVFVAQKNLKRVQRKRIEGPVDLVVEILSESTEEVDRGTKFVAYARGGIPWYWIVDLEHRVLEEYQLVGKSYGKVRKAPFDKPFEPRLFPGLVIDLASLEW